MSGAFPPLILRRRDDRRVVVRLRWVPRHWPHIALRQRPHIFWDGERETTVFYILFVHEELRPRPRARPRPRPRRGGLGGLGSDVWVDVRRTEGRPPPSS